MADPEVPFPLMPKEIGVLKMLASDEKAFTVDELEANTHLQSIEQPIKQTIANAAETLPLHGFANWDVTKGYTITKYGMEQFELREKIAAEKVRKKRFYHPI